MVKQTTLDSWLLQHFSDLLRKGALNVVKTGAPIVLYRNMIEEEEDSHEEGVDFPVAVTARTNKITLLQMDGIVKKDDIKEMIK